MCVTDGSLAISWPWKLVLNQNRNSFPVKSSLAVGHPRVPQGGHRQTSTVGGEPWTGGKRRWASLKGSQEDCGLQSPSVSLWTLTTKDVRTGLPEPKRAKVNITAVSESQFLFFSIFFFLVGVKPQKELYSEAIPYLCTNTEAVLRCSLCLSRKQIFNLAIRD